MDTVPYSLHKKDFWVKRGTVITGDNRLIIVLLQTRCTVTRTGHNPPLPKTESSTRTGNTTSLPAHARRLSVRLAPITAAIAVALDATHDEGFVNAVTLFDIDLYLNRGMASLILYLQEVPPPRAPAPLLLPPDR